MLFFSDILKSLSLHLQLFSAVPWIICTLQNGIYKAATRSNIWISTSFEAGFFMSQFGSIMQSLPIL